MSEDTTNSPLVNTPLVHNYLVEKVGGTSMSRFEVVLENVVKRPSINRDYPNHRRVIVVSAYGGVTNLLLANKKTGAPGLYGMFANGQDVSGAFAALRERLNEINSSFEPLGLDLVKANAFVEERLCGAERFLDRVSQVISFGYVDRATLMLAARELVASIGESHSAFNSVEILNAQGIQAALIDLSGWHDTAMLTIDERINRALKHTDLSSAIGVVTGYCKGTEGIMRVFDRGYSEITFSRIAQLLKAKEAIIHKEYHLSSGDPKLIGPDRVIPIGNTNFDVADQLADIEMEAIHPKASKPLEHHGIPIRVRNVFDPEHAGTLITTTYKSAEPRVEIVSGCDKVVVVEIHDTAMVGEVGFDFRIMKILAQHKVSYTFKSTNANTISVAVLERDWTPELHEELKKIFFSVSSKKVAVICAIGTNMQSARFLGEAANILAEAGITILSVAQSTRQTNIQFLVERSSFALAQKVLHKALCE